MPKPLKKQKDGEKEKVHKHKWTIDQCYGCDCGMCQGGKYKQCDKDDCGELKDY